MKNKLNIFKKKLKQFKFLYYIFTYFRNRRETLINCWIQIGQHLIKRYSLNDFIISNNRTFVLLENETVFLYQLEHFGGLLGAESKFGFENQEFEYIKKQIENKTTFFDIGANYGIYSIQFSRLFPALNIHSFEPVLSTYNVLLENIKINKLFQKNININNIALSSEPGELRITVDRYAGNHLVLNSEKKYEGESDLVLVDTIDNYVLKHKIPKVDFIKCDVEGAEFLVLKGGQRILKEHRPELFLEITTEWSLKFNYTPSDIFKFLSEFNYTAYQFVDANTLKQIDLSSSWNPYIYNYVFKPTETVAT